jgi:hypothetical protein
MEKERLTIVGGKDVEETAGPTAVVFGRERGIEGRFMCLRLAGWSPPVGEGPGLARVVKVDIGVRGE